MGLQLSAATVTYFESQYIFEYIQSFHLGDYFPEATEECLGLFPSSIKIYVYNLYSSFSIFYQFTVLILRLKIIFIYISYFVNMPKHLYFVHCRRYSLPLHYSKALFKTVKVAYIVSALRSILGGSHFLGGVVLNGDSCTSTLV